MNLIFAAGILLSVGSLWLMPFASYVMQATCFFTIGFFVFGPQMLIGMAAAECSHKEAAGAGTGVGGVFFFFNRRGLSACLLIWGRRLLVGRWRKYSIPGTGADFLWLSLSPPGFPHCCYCPF